MDSNSIHGRYICPEKAAFNSEAPLSSSKLTISFPSLRAIGVGNTLESGSSLYLNWFHSGRSDYCEAKKGLYYDPVWKNYFREKPVWR